VGAAEGSDPAANRSKRCFVGVTHKLLGCIEHTVARIEHQGEGEPALRALSAALLELETLVARNPVIKLAVNDLFEAAVALVAGRSVGSGVVDIRRWRLLRDATVRLRARVAVAQPSLDAGLLGLADQYSVERTRRLLCAGPKTA